MGTADTVTISGSATINVTGNLAIKGSGFNVGGSASNLNLAVSGILSATAGGTVIGHVSAGSVSGTGAQTFGGNLTTTTGNITLGSGSTVSGALSSSSGAVILSSSTSGTYTTVGSISTGGNVTVYSYNRVLGATTGALISGGSYAWFGGPVTATSTYVSFADHATVNGNVSAGSYVYTGLYSTINGSITSGSLQVDLAGHTTVSGAITANGTYVNFGSGSSAGGAVTAKTYVDLGAGGNVSGNVTSQTSYVYGSSINVTGNIGAGGSYVDIHSDGNVGGNISAASYVSIYNNNTVSGTVTAGSTVFINDYNVIGSSVLGGGSVTIDDHTNIAGDVTSTGSYVSISTNTTIAGNVTSSTSYVHTSLNSTVNGNVTAATTVTQGSGTTLAQCVRSTGAWTITLSSPTLVSGACCGSGATCSKSCITGLPKPADCQSLHHLKVVTSASSGLTCNPNTATVYACADSTCATYYTSGASGSLTATGSGMTVTYPSGANFTIPSGSNSATVSFQVTTPGSVTLGATISSPSASSATTCALGGSSSCAFTSQDSGFIMTLPSLVAGTAGNLSIAAVQKSVTSNACTPAFASVSKAVNFSCSYSNPNTGTKPAVLGGTALNASAGANAACDGASQAVSLSFNASGVATSTLNYSDAGQVTLSAAYTGTGSQAGLSMTGSGDFIAAPASFALSGITASPIKAGQPFSATITALNSAGVATPNFGREFSAEGARLSWFKAKPTGISAVSGAFTGSGVGGSASLTGFSHGAVTVSDLSWNEVGSGDLTATLVSGSYLGGGQTISGTTGVAGAVGPFVPDHFDLTLSPSCGAFTYSGQPFTVSVYAKEASGGTTRNYDGTAHTSPNQATTVTLTAVNNAATGSLSGNTVAASAFGAGIATSTLTPTFTFTNKLTPVTSISLRATDTNGVSSSPGGVEPTASIYSGRIRMSNAYGSGKASLSIPIQTQRWNGKAWVLNSADNCTSVPAAAVALSGYVNAKGQSTASWTTTPSGINITGGNGTLTLGAPSNSGTGSVDLALNLGSTGTDQSCLASHPASTGANQSALRAQQGSTNACAGLTSYDRDPSARATFGVYSPETNKLVFIRDMF